MTTPPTEQTEGPVVAGSMLEKMARAISDSSSYDSGHWRDWLPQARAALEAIREASEAVKKAGAIQAWNEETFEPGSYDELVAQLVWSTMIDAILRGEA